MVTAAVLVRITQEKLQTEMSLTKLDLCCHTLENIPVWFLTVQLTALWIYS